MVTKNQDMNQECMVYPRPHLCWSAVFAGAFVGIGLGFLLHLFGIAIGLSAYNASSNGAAVLAVGGFIGILIGVIASMGAAGFVSGYLGRFHHCACHGGIIYGFVTWAAALVLSAILVMPLMNYTAFYKNTLTSSTKVMPSNDVSVSHQTSTKTDQSAATEQAGAHNVGTVTSTELAWLGWITFILFFIGAISSCIGASCGLVCRKEGLHVTK